MRSSRLTVLFGALAVVAAIGLFSGPGAPPALAQDGSAPALGPVTGSVANGRELYYEHTCYGCHGFTGESRVRLTGIDSPVLRTEENFIAFLRLRADEAPLFPSTSMPNYSEEVVNDLQAKDLYAFIRSFRGNTPESFEDVPTLNTIVEAASKPYEP